MIPLLNFIFLLLLPLGSTSSITHKPDCPDRCGNVSIPYPFGVGSDCSLEPSFNITCNTSSNPHKPYLNIHNQTIEVVDIKLDNPTQIRIKYPYLLSVACYNISTQKDGWEEFNTIDLSETQYTISEDNWLTAVGCDDFVSATTFVGNKTFRDACIGFCSDPHNSSSNDGGICPSNAEGNSAGEGCCRSPIPKGTSFLAANLVDMSKSVSRSRLFPCSYALVEEKGVSTDPGYSYNFYVLQHSSKAFLQAANNIGVVRLDWRIRAQNCSQARQNSSFVCRENSDCIDFGADIGGYLCNCSEGYQGNPYLYPGCQAHRPILSAGIRSSRSNLGSMLDTWPLSFSCAVWPPRLRFSIAYPRRSQTVRTSSRCLFICSSICIAPRGGGLNRDYRAARFRRRRSFDHEVR